MAAIPSAWLEERHGWDVTEAATPEAVTPEAATWTGFGTALETSTSSHSPRPQTARRDRRGERARARHRGAEYMRRAARIGLDGGTSRGDTSNNQSKSVWCFHDWT